MIRYQTKELKDVAKPMFDINVQGTGVHGYTTHASHTGDVNGVLHM